MKVYLSISLYMSAGTTILSILFNNSYINTVRLLICSRFISQQSSQGYMWSMRCMRN